MKTAMKFAAHKLTKGQMNMVKGGAVYHHVNCMIVDLATGNTVEWSHSTMGDTLQEALINMNAYLKEGQHATDCHHDLIFA